MIRPDERVIHGLVQLARHNLAVVEWLGESYRLELERLPYAGDNLAVLQGRCQVFSELYKLINDAPKNLTAKHNGSPS